MISGPGVTPLILTLNEAPNIARVLERLDWADEVVVLDSFSADETVSIAKQVRSVRVVQRRFDTHAAQWTAGVAECSTEWVLALDADYVLSSELVSELSQWKPAAGIDAYFCRFRYCVGGVTLRGSLYPPRAVLFRRDRCHFVQDGHTQTLQVPGKVGWLRGVILHDDRKAISQWIAGQDRYARLEVEKLLNCSAATLGAQDRLRRHVVVAPVVVFIYTLLWKGLILDGWHGWFYVCQRTLAELMLSLRLVEAKLQGRRPKPARRVAGVSGQDVQSAVNRISQRVAGPARPDGSRTVRRADSPDPDPRPSA